MAYEVLLNDDSVDLVDADAYVLEGPLTTFFRSETGKSVIDSWATRLASYRTADIRRIRALVA